MNQPTPYTDLNMVLQELVSSVQAVLPDNLFGIILQGSFGTGDFDEHSDVDFTVVIERPLTETELAALQTMHDRIYDLDCPWAQHLEGSYFPLALLNDHTALGEKLHYLDNCSRQLEPSTHDNTLVVRWVTREQGIALAGPDPSSFMKPVPASGLRQEVVNTMDEWGAEILSGQYGIDSRWAQSFVVLSYGRMLHTLHTGRIHSKLAAVKWAKSHLEAQWHRLLQRAWAERPFPGQKVHQAADPTEKALTLDFIRYTLNLNRKRAEIRALYDEKERKNRHHPSFQREIDGTIVRHINKEPTHFSFVIYSKLTAETADAAIQAQLDYFQVSGNAGFEWKTYDHDTPPDLKARLAAHGLQAGEAEALMVIDLQHCPPALLQPVTVDVRRVTTAVQFQDIAAIQEQVWGVSFAWIATQLKENATLHPDYWSIYIIYVNNKPACAAWASFPNGNPFAGLWGGATVEKYRKMGLYTAVVATRTQEAIRRGYRFLTVDASQMSRPILEKHGFQLLTHTTPYIWKNPTLKKRN